MRISMSLNPNDIDNAIRRIDEYNRKLKQRCMELCERLANIGQLTAQTAFDGVKYLGLKDVTVSVQQTRRGYRILANGETALLLEFGAGVTLGYGHPYAERFGMGPGTYPNGKGHWNDPRGWWLPKSAGGGHTYGNVPGKAMYNAESQIRQYIGEVAREVFAGD